MSLLSFLLLLLLLLLFSPYLSLSRQIRALRGDGSTALAEITTKIMVGIACATAAFICLLAAVIVQIYLSLETYTVLLFSLICIVSFYLLYEILRVQAVFTFKALPQSTQDEMISAAYTNNESYHESLQELLDNHGIADEGDWGVDPSARVRLTMPPPREEETVMYGYKRIYSALLICAIFGILCCTALKTSFGQPTGERKD